MAQEVTYRLEDAQRRCERLSRHYIEETWRGIGEDPESALAGFKAHHSFLAFPSSYRLLLQIEWHRAGKRHLHNDYFLLLEQHDRTYRIEDLQLPPQR